MSASSVSSRSPAAVDKLVANLRLAAICREAVALRRGEDTLVRWRAAARN